MLEQTDRVQLQIEFVDQLHCAGFCFIDDQAAVADVISERRHAAHPQPLAPGGGDLVPDSFSRDFALELREREQNVQREPTHGGGCIELLSNSNKGDALRIEYLTILAKSESERVSRSTL